MSVTKPTTSRQADYVTKPAYTGGGGGPSMRRLAASDFASLSPTGDDNSQSGGAMSIVDGVVTIPMLGAAAGAFGSLNASVNFEATCLDWKGRAITEPWHHYMWLMGVRVYGVVPQSLACGIAVHHAALSGGGTNDTGGGVGLVGVGGTTVAGQAHRKRSAWGNAQTDAHADTRVAWLRGPNHKAVGSIDQGYSGWSVTALDVAGTSRGGRTVGADTNEADADRWTRLSVWASWNAATGAVDTSAVFLPEILVVPVDEIGEAFGSRLFT